MQKFIIKSPNGHLLEHVMRTDMITIGRDPSNDIVLNAPSVSRRHARIYIWEGKYCIEDLGSSNGTYVNGHQINEAVTIDPSCLVDVGGFVVSFSGAPSTYGSGDSGNGNQQAQQRPSTGVRLATATAAATGAVRLVGLSEPVRDQVYSLPPSGEITVGRADNNAIVIHHNSISRNHVRIIVGVGGDVLIQDLNSSNGTYINDSKVNGKQKVEPGAQVRIGHVTLRLETPNMPKATRKPSQQSASESPEKLSQVEIIKYGIIFLVLIIIMLVLTVVLIYMLRTTEPSSSPTLAPPPVAEPMKTLPNK